jgi:hypothetical protein
MKRALLCPNCRVVVRDPYTEQLEAELAVALNAELDRPYRPGVTVYVPPSPPKTVEGLGR